MRLIIVRHGESEGDILNVHEGRADFHLTERGHAQAEALGLYIRDNYKVDKIYASPLKRAHETAQHISENTGVSIIKEELLMEFNNGLLAGLSWEEADEKYPRILNLPIHEAVYEQESKLEFRHRAEVAVSKIITEAKKEEALLQEKGLLQDEKEITVLVVSHGGMINQLFHVLLKMPVEDGVVFATGDTGLHEWIVRDDVKYLLKENCQEHLKEC